VDWLIGHIASLGTPENLLALVTLTALEIVLGIDNIIFIAILSAKLPADQQDKARRVGLLAAMVMRILLLLGVGWISRLTEPWATFKIYHLEVALSGRNLILIVGGLVLMAKSSREIYHKTEGAHDATLAGKAATFAGVIAQIMLMDLVFSIDSVITAVGMAQSVLVMIIAVVLSVAVMMFFAGPISRFVDRRPSLKMLALAFLMLIGFMLIADGFGHHVPKGYIYFAMAFALGVEILNMRSERKRTAHKAPTG
jgi:predicted tellurium resistance membrane protein TerC